MVHLDDNIICNSNAPHRFRTSNLKGVDFKYIKKEKKQESPKLIKDVNKITSPMYWIDFKDLKSYEVYN